MGGKVTGQRAKIQERSTSAADPAPSPLGGCRPAPEILDEDYSLAELAYIAKHGVGSFYRQRGANYQDDHYAQRRVAERAQSEIIVAARKITAGQIDPEQRWIQGAELCLATPLADPEFYGNLQLLERNGLIERRGSRYRVAPELDQRLADVPDDDHHSLATNGNGAQFISAQFAGEMITKRGLGSYLVFSGQAVRAWRQARADVDRGRADYRYQLAIIDRLYYHSRQSESSRALTIDQLRFPEASSADDDHRLQQALDHLAQRQIVTVHGVNKYSLYLPEPIDNYPLTGQHQEVNFLISSTPEDYWQVDGALQQMYRHAQRCCSTPAEEMIFELLYQQRLEDRFATNPRSEPEISVDELDKIMTPAGYRRADIELAIKNQSKPGSGLFRYLGPVTGEMIVLNQPREWPKINQPGPEQLVERFRHYQVAGYYRRCGAVAQSLAWARNCPLPATGPALGHGGPEQRQSTLQRLAQEALKVNPRPLTLAELNSGSQQQRPALAANLESLAAVGAIYIQGSGRQKGYYLLPED